MMNESLIDSFADAMQNLGTSIRFRMFGTLRLQSS
jgi:hypothetical protein